jgi:DNA-binding MarR family transcriptional regulator
MVVSGSAAVGAWESLFRAQVAVVRELGKDFPTGDISFNEYDVLFNLTRQDGRRLRIRDLSRHLLLTQPSVSRMVDRLVTKGLVVKESDPGDGRGTFVCLTDSGYSLYRRVAAMHAKSIERLVGESLDPDELAALQKLTERIRLSVDGAAYARGRTDPTGSGSPPRAGFSIEALRPAPSCTEDGREGPRKHKNRHEYIANRPWPTRFAREQHPAAVWPELQHCQRPTHLVRRFSNLEPPLRIADGRQLKPARLLAEREDELVHLCTSTGATDEIDRNDALCLVENPQELPHEVVEVGTGSR